MTAVTAARIFMFTFVAYCVLVANDSPQRFERGAQIFQQWTAVSAAKASFVTNEVTLEARESVRAFRRVLEPMRLDRRMKTVRQRVTSRTTIFKSYAIAQFRIDSAGTTNQAGRC
jgi:hypothetical protein